MILPNTLTGYGVGIFIFLFLMYWFYSLEYPNLNKKPKGGRDE